MRFDYPLATPMQNINASVATTEGFIANSASRTLCGRRLAAFVDADQRAGRMDKFMNLDFLRQASGNEDEMALPPKSRLSMS